MVKSGFSPEEDPRSVPSTYLGSAQAHATPVPWVPAYVHIHTSISLEITIINLFFAGTRNISKAGLSQMRFAMIVGVS